MGDRGAYLADSGTHHDVVTAGPVIRLLQPSRETIAVKLVDKLPTALSGARTQTAASPSIGVSVAGISRETGRGDCELAPQAALIAAAAALDWSYAHRRTADTAPACPDKSTRLLNC